MYGKAVFTGFENDAKSSVVIFLQLSYFPWVAKW